MITKFKLYELARLICKNCGGTLHELLPHPFCKEEQKTDTSTQALSTRGLPLSTGDNRRKT